MNEETNNKIETIIISVVNRLYSKEENIGLDIEDLRALEIISKIAKEAKSSASTAPLASPTIPSNLMDLLRAVKVNSNDHSE